MNFRTTVILLIVLVGAAVFFFVANRSGTDPDKTAKNADKDDQEKGRLLLSVKTSDIRKVVIRPGEGAPAGGKTLELSQAAGKWNILQPINWPADSFEVQNLVDAVVSARSGGSLDVTPDKASEWGLAKPRYRIELSDAGGKAYKLTVGNRSPMGYLYVQTDDEKTAYVLSGGPLAERLSKPTDKVIASLRDKQILRISSFDVKQARINVQSGASIAMEKPVAGPIKPGEAPEWKMTSPVQEPVDSGEASDLISTLTNLRADEFSSESTAASAGAGFDRPQAVVTLSAAAPATQPSTMPSTGPSLPGGVTVTIGQAVDIEGEKCWIKVSEPPTIAKVTLNKAAIEKISKATPMSLRDRKVFAAEPAQVSEVTITSETASTTQPAEQKTVKLQRRHEKAELGPFLPKSNGPSTAPTTEPTAPATQPATKPVARHSNAEWLHEAAQFVSSINPARLLDIGMSSYLAADAVPATQPAAPATQPAPPATQPAAEPPSTQASTQPAIAAATTAPSTHPATGPAAAAAATRPAIPFEPPKPPPTQWVVASKSDIDANDETVTQFLSDFNPLRAAKYLDKVPAPSTQPATQPTAVTYTITLKTVAAGGAAKTYELKVTDPGGGAKPYAQYQELIFEVDAALIDRLKGDFTEAPKPTAPAFPRGGGPPGGFPGGGGGFP